MAHSRFTFMRFIAWLFIVKPISLLWNHLFSGLLYMLLFPISEIFLMLIDKDRGFLDWDWQPSSSMEESEQSSDAEDVAVPPSEPIVSTMTSTPPPSPLVRQLDVDAALEQEASKQHHLIVDTSAASSKTDGQAGERAEPIAATEEAAITTTPLEVEDVTGVASPQEVRFPQEEQEVVEQEAEPVATATTESTEEIKQEDSQLKQQEFLSTAIATPTTPDKMFPGQSYDDYYRRRDMPPARNDMMRHSTYYESQFAGPPMFDSYPVDQRYRYSEEDVRPLQRRKMFNDSNFYETAGNTYPTIEDQKALAKRVSLSLESDKNLQSQGYFLFMDRRGHADDWTFDEERREKDYLMVPPSRPSGNGEVDDGPVVDDEQWSTESHMARMPERADVFDTYNAPPPSNEPKSAIRRRYEQYQNPKPRPPPQPYYMDREMISKPYSPPKHHHRNEGYQEKSFEQPADLRPSHWMAEDYAIRRQPPPAHIAPPRPPRPTRITTAHVPPRSYKPMSPVASVNPHLSDIYVSDKSITPQNPDGDSRRSSRSRGLSATDLEDLRLSAEKCEHTSLTPETCFSLTAEMKSRSGRGGEMFAQRARRMNKFVFDNSNQRPTSSGAYPFASYGSYRHQQATSSLQSSDSYDDDYTEGYYHPPRSNSFDMADQGRKISVLQTHDNTASSYPDDYEAMQQQQPTSYDYSRPTFQQPQQSHFTSKQYLQPTSYSSHTSSTLSVHSSREHSRGSTPKPGWAQTGKSVDPDFLAHLSQTVPKSPSMVSPALQDELHPFEAK